MVALSDAPPASIIDPPLLMSVNGKLMAHKYVTLAGLLCPNVFQGIVVHLFIKLAKQKLEFFCLLDKQIIFENVKSLT